MNIFSCAGDTISAPEGTEAGWQITAEFHNTDSSFSRITNKRNIRMIPSTLFLYPKMVIGDLMVHLNMVYHLFKLMQIK